jgi:hypothetical protein
MQKAIVAWRRRSKKWVQQLRRRKRKHPRLMAFLKLVYVFILIGIAELLIFISLLFAGLLGLLDMRTIVSVAVTEVGIGILLYYMLGEHRRGRLDEIVNLMDACAKFSHLKVFTYQMMSFHYYYVVNTLTKQAYVAPTFIENIVDDGVFEVVTCKNQKEMKRKFREEKIKLNDYEPSLADLTNPNNSNRKP